MSRIEGSGGVGRKGERAPLLHWLVRRSSVAVIGWPAGAVVPSRSAPPVARDTGITSARGVSGGLEAVSARRRSVAAGPLRVRSSSPRAARAASR